MGQESSHELLDDSVPSHTLKSRTIASVAQLIKDGKADRIVVLTGAGLSTAAGIPDFRSPNTGLYANLARLNLPYAEAVFDISYFRGNPHPFYALAKELYPGKYKPTLAHCFIALLAEKDLLHKLFTQNIDCLERAAGVPGDLIVEAHGSFATQRCIDCQTEYPDDLMIKNVETGDIPHCLVPQCNGLVKPDIVFFGEALPAEFGRERPKLAQAQLVIIMGTSLSVQPFASLPDFALEGTPRLLLNRERVGSLGSRPDDVCFLSDCDDGVRQLAEALGWKDELEEMWMKRSGRTADDVEKEAAGTRLTKDERLEAEIERLTGEVDQALKISNDHKEWLEKNLEKKEEHGKAVADEKELQRGKMAFNAAGETTPTDSVLLAKDEDEADQPNSSNLNAEPDAKTRSVNIDTVASIEARGDYHEIQPLATLGPRESISSPHSLDSNNVPLPHNNEPKNISGFHI